MISITSLDDFRSKVAHRDEIREAEILPGLVSFCYMISAEGTFDTPELRECRGIVFDKETGKVVGRPLHKFFNVNERESSRVENLSKHVARLMDKRDGSMIHTVDVGGMWRLKSKKSFESDVAQMATDLARDDVGLYKLCHEMMAINCTAIFEFTSPVARIVLPYQKPELQLLHVRENESGRYWSTEELTAIADRFDVTCVEEYDLGQGKLDVDLSLLLLDASYTENCEGWVVQFPDGEMVKVKTDWYLKRHRAMTFLRERDIAQLVLDEGLDDVKSLLVGDGVNIEDILQIETRVVNKIRFIARDVENILLMDDNLDRKTFAIKYKDHEHFGLLMSAYTGKEPDYKGYFERNMLRTMFSLRQLNLLDTVAEGE